MFASGLGGFDVGIQMLLKKRTGYSIIQTSLMGIQEKLNKQASLDG